MTSDDSKPVEVHAEAVEAPVAMPKPVAAADDLKHPAQLAGEDYSKVKLSWKTWVVVFISCFA
jgi:hypothetical protein